jgi:hypothetical protein
MDGFRVISRTLLALVAISALCGAEKEIRRVPLKISQIQSSILLGAAKELYSFRIETGKQLDGIDAELKGLDNNSLVGKVKPVYAGLLSQAKDVASHAKVAFEKGLDDNGKRVSDAFFGDIIDRYVLSGRNVETMTGSNITQVKKAVLSDVSRTERLYQAVAYKGELTFNLRVLTNPQGAVITYRRRTEDFEQADNPSNTTIENLVVANWCIHVELPGYKPQETWHDAATDSVNEVVFDLQPN